MITTQFQQRNQLFMQWIIQNKIAILIITLIFQVSAFSQVPKKVEKLAGIWNFEGGSGYEVFVLKNGELYGESYLKTKVGITYHVENIRIKYVNRNLIYETIPLDGDSLLVGKKSTFIANGKKMKFVHVQNAYPASVRYKLACFNKNKLKIFIYPIVGDQKKKVLRLTRNINGTL